MRAAAIVIGLGLGAAGCSLDFGDRGAADAAIIDAARAPCDVGPRYRMMHYDCGPTPPDSEPFDCWWTIDLEPAWDPGTIRWCYTDVCESFAYACTGGTVAATSTSGSGWSYTGTLLPNGNLRWEGDYENGEYQPY
jgi:hypothetical protein